MSRGKCPGYMSGGLCPRTHQNTGKLSSNFFGEIFLDKLQSLKSILMILK